MTGLVPAGLRFAGGEPQVEWLRPDGLRFTEPFFEHTLGRLRRRPENAAALRVRTPVEALADIAPGRPPEAFIFHVSRCGSTLVAQMLAALPRNRVVAEPPVLDDILGAWRHDPGIADAQRLRWFRGAVHALAAAGGPDHDRLFVKLDSWHLFEVPLVRRAFPGVPLLFVHRDPLEVLVSLMRRPSLTLVRGTVTPEQLGLTAAERDALPAEEHAAAILGAFFHAATRHRAALVPVAYPALPDFVWESMPGGPCTGAERAILQAAATRSAKEPEKRFAPDSAEKRRTASAATAAACARWAEPAYRRWLEAVKRGV